jgi:hypothetical protein
MIKRFEGAGRMTKWNEINVHQTCRTDLISTYAPKPWPLNKKIMKKDFINCLFLAWIFFAQAGYSHIHRNMDNSKIISLFTRHARGAIRFQTSSAKCLFENVISHSIICCGWVRHIFLFKIRKEFLINHVQSTILQDIQRFWSGQSFCTAELLRSNYLPKLRFCRS